MTKTAIACVAVRLASRDVLDLDDPLPDHRHSLRALLRHTARLPCYGGMPRYHQAVAQGEDAWSPEELIDNCDELSAPAGWAYSNLGYLHARHALEGTTGRTLSDLLRDEILDPLGLDRTRLAQGREAAWPGYDFGWVYHGCLLGPASEAAAMMEGILGGALLDPVGVAEMTDRTRLGGALGGRPWADHGYGMGLMIGATRSGTAIGHSGAGPGSTCAVYRIEGTVIAAFAESDAPGPTERAVVRSAARPDRAPPAPGPPRSARSAG